MRQILLTGLAEETDFSNEVGSSKYFLVFNNGALRIPVSQEAALEVARYVYGSNNGETSLQTGNNGTDHEFVQDEEPPAEGGIVDEDGVGQI